jgi:NADH-quinone oxidoreductase subunit G
MTANLSVSEPKPPEDPDSPLSYTMEGLRAMPPSSIIPFFWAPGWNSVQSVNKYQEEVGAALRGGDPGKRLLEPKGQTVSKYFMAVPEVFRPLDGHLWLVPVYHIFGSDELSAHSPAVAERMPTPYVMLSKKDSESLEMTDGKILGFQIDGQPYALPVRVSDTLPTGLAGVPMLDGLNFSELPAWALLKKSEVKQKTNA